MKLRFFDIVSGRYIESGKFYHIQAFYRKYEHQKKYIDKDVVIEECFGGIWEKKELLCHK